MDYGSTKKIIQFEELDKTHADLKIRLHYDGIRQGEFFRAIVQGYINGEEGIVSYIEKYKQKKQKSYSNSEMSKKTKKTIESFGLDEDEIENIFDLIAREQEGL